MAHGRRLNQNSTHQILFWFMFCCLLLSVTQIIVVNLSRSDQFWIPSSPSESASSSTASAPTAARPITVFYNVYADPDRIDNARDIVSEQMQHIMPEHRVFVRSIGAQFPIENATRIQHDQEGSEFETLGILWNYCHDSPHAENDTVVYIHNKGSFHPSKVNTMFRRFITPGALSRECSEMPPECNICSFRFSPLPHPHSPGNMWAARCNYIKLLLDPNKFEWEMERFYNISKMKEYSAAIGTGRYAAEHWVHSHPAVSPCDLSTGHYAWGYKGIATAEYKLEQAPRYNKTMFMVYSGREYWVESIRWLHVGHRLKEYIFLYNQTPPETWFGWSFYKPTKGD
ncbi:hypothetical protein ACHAWO_011789 [Cyclotella atomus]|uniref:Uncharacterized protein n=1 Tax=Cyclotella atomus TaxID=382360 RepID=A0ABD3NZ87_9STRA